MICGWINIMDGLQIGRWMEQCIVAYAIYDEWMDDRLIDGWMEAV